MDTEQTKTLEGPDGLLCGETTEKALAAFYAVYNELGNGFMESVYSRAFATELRFRGVQFESNVPIEILYRGTNAGFFRADHIVEGSVLIELKAAGALTREHEQQVLNYLHATSLEVALLMNFGPKPTFKRFVLSNDRKRYRGVSV